MYSTLLIIRLHSDFALTLSIFHGHLRRYLMDLPINKNNPLTMHVDLNSCFATIEQQANPLLRGKPLAIVAYNSPAGCVVAPSIEAKRFGVKTGMSLREAKLLCPSINV